MRPSSDLARSLSDRPILQLRGILWRPAGQHAPAGEIVKTPEGFKQSGAQQKAAPSARLLSQIPV
jgi:hypothetical protein